VYGLLLRGEEKHDLLASAQFVAEARTTATFALVDLGPYPALVKGGAVSVVGEVYALDAPALARIDVHEGHPVLFKRALVPLEGGEEAFAYLLDTDQVRGRRRIRSGSWRGRHAPAAASVGVRDAAFVKWARTRKP
jgi:gamma-glutamylcyclotransferase (GGCT)/AIG2-like uncharacterized protein YtfP